jgi:hypothetical protein
MSFAFGQASAGAAADAAAGGISGRPTATRTLFSISRAMHRVGAQELARVVLALADLLAVVGVPGAGLVDDLVLTPRSMISPSREMPSP